MRGSNVLIFLSVILAAAAAVRPAAGQTAPPAKSAPQQTPAPMTTQKIASGLYLVKGGAGANSAFYVAGKEVFVIDAKMTPEAARDMLAAVKAVTSLPVTTVILTHSDGDHVNGLPGFPKGLKIVAHVNCKADIEAASADLPALKDYIPSITYTERLEFRGKAGGVELRNYGPAHTSGDTVVYFPSLKTAFVGDLIFLGRDPLIHLKKGGSSEGYIKTLHDLLDFKPAVETFLSGHADPASRKDVDGLVKSLEERRARVKVLVSEGKSLDEIKAAFGIEEAPQGGRRFPSFVEVVYQELTEKK